MTSRITEEKIDAIADLAVRSARDGSGAPAISAIDSEISARESRHSVRVKKWLPGLAESDALYLPPPVSFSAKARFTRQGEPAPMTRSELIQEIARQFPMLTPQDVAAAVAELLDQMSEVLAKGERINIHGFGSFFVPRRRSARSERV